MEEYFGGGRERSPARARLPAPTGAPTPRAVQCFMVQRCSLLHHLLHLLQLRELLDCDLRVVQRLKRAEEIGGGRENSPAILLVPALDVAPTPYGGCYGS